MKINTKILSLLIVLIAIVSISSVSAAEDIGENQIAVTDDNNVAEIQTTFNDVAEIQSPTDINVIADNAETHEIADGANATVIQQIIDNTTAGDTISFAKNGNYNLGNNSAINIVHTLVVEGNGATLTGAQGFLIQGGNETTDGTQVHDLNFIMVSETGYNGRALDIRSTNNLVVDNCTFKDGNAGIRLQRCTNTTITNNKFTGTTNASSIGTRNEEGTKAINLMGGSKHYIANNTFEKDVLDGVSIASGASNVNMTRNTFNDNWYGIFYGGGVTNISTTENTFDNCKVYAIGLVKAAGETVVDNNTFTIPEEASAIYIEQGNTAHGAPSNIENVTITNNEFSANDTTQDVANAVYIKTNKGALDPTGTLNISDNTYNDQIAPLTIIQGNWDVNGNDVIIEPSEYDTYFVGDKDTELKLGKTYEIQLLDENNVILANKDVNVTIIKNNKTIENFKLETSNLGIIEVTMNDVGNLTIETTFNGENKYHSSKGSFNVSVSTYDVVFFAENATIVTAAKQRYEVILKDENNKLLPNKTVQFTVNGITYKRTTNENGVAGLNINLPMGDYNITTVYTDEEGKVYNQTNTITSVRSNTTILSTPVTFQGKGHKFVATLVNQLGNPLSDKAVAFHINGVKYYRLTDENGQFSLTINLLPGIYNMYMSFDGTGQYAPCNGGSEITVI